MQVIKIVSVKEPTIKSFEEAKDELTPLYRSDKSKEMLAKLSEENVKKYW